MANSDGENNSIESIDNSGEKQLKALLEEYKEMRNEIRTAYGQYYSIFFGIFLIGILGTFNLAFEKKYLFIAIPFMIIGWISVIIIMRLNIQHIAKYITRVEKDINNILGANSLEYESNYAKKLWFSKIIKIIASVPLIMLAIIYFVSVYNSFHYLEISLTSFIGVCIKWLFVVFSCLLLFISIYAFAILPERIFKKK